MYNDYSIKPISGPISETIARAKKDIKKGEAIDGIGGYCVRDLNLLQLHAYHQYQRYIL